MKSKVVLKQIIRYYIWDRESRRKIFQKKFATLWSDPMKDTKDSEKLDEYLQSEERLKHLDVSAAKVIKVSTGSKFDIPEGAEVVDVCQAERELINKAKEEAQDKGVDLMAKLMKILLSEKRFDDATKATDDVEYRTKLMKEYKLVG